MDRGCDEMDVGAQSPAGNRERISVSLTERRETLRSSTTSTAVPSGGSALIITLCERGRDCNRDGE